MRLIAEICTTIFIVAVLGWVVWAEVDRKRNPTPYYNLEQAGVEIEGCAKLGLGWRFDYFNYPTVLCVDTGESK